jgi:hypothetical protein
MSHQEILFNPQALLQYHQQRITEIKNSLPFNGQMAEHYQHLYNKHKRSRNMVRAAFFWLRWQHYDKQCWNIKVNAMLQERGIKPIMP